VNDAALATLAIQSLDFDLCVPEPAGVVGEGMSVGVGERAEEAGDLPDRNSSCSKTWSHSSRAPMETVTPLARGREAFLCFPSLEGGPGMETTTR
jgi:hypothetical protein